MDISAHQEGSTRHLAGRSAIVVGGHALPGGRVQVAVEPTAHRSAVMGMTICLIPYWSDNTAPALNLAAGTFLKPVPQEEAPSTEGRT
jgi:hypothetical protein